MPFFRIIDFCRAGIDGKYSLGFLSAQTHGNLLQPLGREKSKFMGSAAVKRLVSSRAEHACCQNSLLLNKSPLFKIFLFGLFLQQLHWLILIKLQEGREINIRQ